MEQMLHFSTVLAAYGVDADTAGQALYLKCCSAAHSCRPNAILIASEDGGVLRAILPIEAQEAVCVLQMGQRLISGPGDSELHTSTDAGLLYSNKGREIAAASTQHVSMQLLQQYDLGAASASSQCAAAGV